MKHGIITAPQPEAVEVGADVLTRGGNTVDAAIATALVQTAVHRAATATMWQDRIVAETEGGFGYILKGRENECGYGAITTPMTLNAFDDALSKFSTMSLADLLEPAIDYAENGFLVHPHVVCFLESSTDCRPYGICRTDAPLCCHPCNLYG